VCGYVMMPWGMSCSSDKMAVVLYNESRTEMTSESHQRESNSAGSKLDFLKLCSFGVALPQNEGYRRQIKKILK